MQGFGGTKLKERDHLETLGTDGRLILKWVFKKCNGGVSWRDLAQYRDKCRRHVNVAISLRTLQIT